MYIFKKFDFFDFKMWVKFVKGMGYNYYGEFVWFNDFFYIFLVVIFGIIVCVVGLVVLDLVMFVDKVDFFVIFLEIFFEWYFYFVFQILWVVFNKFLGIVL